MSGPFKLEHVGQWREAGARAARILKFEESKAVLDHWLSIGDDLQPPARWRIDPLNMVGSLPKTFLMEFDEERDSLTYAVAGDDVAAKYGYDLRGKRLSDIVDPPAYPDVAEYFLRCIKRPAIMILSGRLFQERVQPGFGERVLLPLFKDDADLFHTGAFTTDLLGITVQIRAFEDREAAYRGANRTLFTIPLDGSDIVEEER